MLLKNTLISLTVSIVIAANVWAAEPASDGSLKQIMQQLGKDYSNLSHAILIEDFVGAAEAAQAIADHDKPALGQRMKVFGELGSEMSAFKSADKKVHDLALSVEEAAKAKDMPLLIKYHAQMLTACMSCHTPYRSKIVNLQAN